MTDKPKVQVTQADRERLAKYYADGGANRLLCGRIRAGDLDSDPHLQMVAAHRIAAEQSRDDVIEECARVADEWTGGVMIQCMTVQSEQQTADAIAQAIRNMGDGS